jgi:hypothetical protein
LAESKTSKEIERSKQNWHLSLNSGVNTSDPLKGQYYGVSIERRIIGPFYLGVLVNTKKDIGVSVGISL